MSKALPDNEIVTVECVLAFPDLFEPRAFKGGDGDPKFQCVVLIPEDVDLRPFYKCIEAAMIERFGKPIKLPRNKNPLKECADKDYEGFHEGWRYINARSGFMPTVVDRKRDALLDPDLFEVDPKTAIARAKEKIFAGCWCRFHLQAYAWEHPWGGRGVSFSLSAVQLVKKGERLDGRRSVEDVFSVLDVDDVDFDDGVAENEDGAESFFG